MFTRKEVQQVRQLCIACFGEHRIYGAPPPPTREELIRREVEEIVAADRWARFMWIELYGRRLCSPWSDSVTREWAKDVLKALLPELERKARN